MIEKLLETIPDKHIHNTTTSHKFKRDLWNYFKEIEGSELFHALELGTHLGQTTRILGNLFKKVYTINSRQDGKPQELNKDLDNIEYLEYDLYKSKWWEDIHGADVVFIDALHEYDAVLYDIESSLKVDNNCLTKKYFVFDDYGLLEPVRSAINTALLSGQIIKVKEIGHPAGTRITPEHYFSAPEGLICREA